MSQSPSSYTVICSQCELEVDIPALGHRQKAACPRCGHLLSTYYRYGIEVTLSLALTALFFLLLSLPFNFLSFRASGQQHNIDLPAGLQVLIENDYLSLALITGIATLVLPGIVLLGVLTLTIAQKWGTPSPWLHRVHHMVELLSPWSMAEIFLLGTLVSLIKITSMAEIAIGMSFYAFVIFTISMTACLIYYDENRTLVWLHKGAPPLKSKLTQSQASFSIQRTWALLFTATLLYVPANVLPIMHTELFGRDEPNTIFGGVISLWQSGSYPIAMIIFIASIVVPILKLVILSYLNYAVQSGDVRKPEQQIRYYRFTEFIGRWSMIDVFVVAILVALIQLGSTISVTPGPAALAFCGVVFITMVAAMTFDSRLLWTEKDKNTL